MLSRALRQATIKNFMAVQANRAFLKDLDLDANALAMRDDAGAKDKKPELQLWKDMADKQKNALVLSNDDEIERYVLSIVRDYFRTTRKAALNLDSAFAEHGLDSLDAIEFVIKIEDELGYVIDAEKLELFKKPRHFVNYIKQLEAYKTEFNKLPHQVEKHKWSVYQAFPGLPKIGK